MAPAPVLTRCSYGPLCGLTQSLRLPVLTKVINWGSQPNRLLKKSSRKESGQNLECADNGGALDFLAFRYLRIQSGVALRPPQRGCRAGDPGACRRTAKYVCQHPAKSWQHVEKAYSAKFLLQVFCEHTRLHAFSERAGRRMTS